MPQPHEQDGKRRGDGDADVEILDVIDQLVPVLAELVADAGNYADPQYCAEEVEQSKTLPLHAQHAGERTGNHAQAEDEAGEEDRDRAVLVEEALAAGDGCRRDAKEFPITVEQRAPSAISDGETKIVPNCGRAHAYQDDVDELELVSRIREKAGQKQDRLARHRNAGVLKQQGNRDRPVAIVSDVVLECLENGLVLKVDSGVILSCSSQAFRFTAS